MSIESTKKQTINYKQNTVIIVLKNQSKGKALNIEFYVLRFIYILGFVICFFNTFMN